MSKTMIPKTKIPSTERAVMQHDPEFAMENSGIVSLSPLPSALLWTELATQSQTDE